MAHGRGGTGNFFGLTNGQFYTQDPTDVRFVMDTTGKTGLGTPVLVEPGSASDGLYVDSANRVGLGTSFPAAAAYVRRTNGTAELFGRRSIGDQGQPHPVRAHQ